MATVLISCKNYQVIKELPFGTKNLPALCRQAEIESNDEYAVFASRDGKIIADAEGYCDADRPDQFDLACERRYD